MGKKGGTNIQAPEPVNPYEVAQADFLYNRLSQNTPFSNLQFTGPGQAPPPGQQVGFLNNQLTGQAQNVFGGGGKGQVPAPQGNKGGSQVSNNVAPKGGRPQPQTLGGGQFNGTRGSFIPPQPTGSTSQFPSGNNVIGSGQTATATQTLSPAMLAIENAKTTSTANTLADVLSRQQGTQNLPALLENLDFGAAGRGGNINNLNTGVGVNEELDLSGLQGLPTDPELFREQTSKDLFELGAAPLREEQTKQFEGIQQALINRGIPLDSQAAERTLGEFSERNNEALRRLGLESGLAAGQEASRGISDIRGLRSQGFSELGTQEDLRRGLRSQLFGENVQTEGIAEQLRGARLGEQLQGGSIAQSARTQQLNELRTLLGQQQVGAPPLQSFLGTSGTGVTDAFGLNVAGQNARAQTQADLAGSKKGGGADLLGSLGSAAITKYSDIRLKENIKSIGQMAGHNWYSYNYLWSDTPQIGVMAQEVMKVNPSAVSEGELGFLQVDYGAL